MDKMKVMLSSLGCDKNLVDSEMMLGILLDNGFEYTGDENEADIIVVNTCSFILDSKQESIDTLIEYGQLKKTGKLKLLVCAGCLAQRYPGDIKKELPEVDIIIGTTAFDKIAEAVNSYFDNKEKECILRIDDIDKKLIYGKRRELSAGSFYAYLKIAEGCDKKCTYCAIPGIRGSYRSVPMDVLINEAESLAGQGVKELILVAQETTVYGTDIYGKKMLHELLKKLCIIDGIEWIRVMYCYPEEIYDELIDTIASEKKICHYLDIPIQHSDDRILQKMGRRTNEKYLRELITKLRDRIPDIAVRTTVITGFPGETDEEAENLVSFVKDMRFERLGAFTYSPEDGTIAADMDGQVDEDIKAARKEKIMLLQQEIAFEKAESLIGKTLPVIIEGRLDDGALVGRTYMDAPDVDGYVFIDSDLDLESGKVMDVRITGSNEYDLIGEFLQ